MKKGEKTVKNLLDLEDLDTLKLNPRPRTYAKCVPSSKILEDIPKWKKNFEMDSEFLLGNFSDSKETTFHEEHLAVAEARRCLKCADAPCSKSCPSQIDIKSFMQCISNKNYYGAAKIIFTDNPNGLSCGNICPVSKYCAGACNLKENPINISGLQAFAIEQFKRMYFKGGLQQIVPKERQEKSKNDPSYNTKIGLIGAGPASISCATFLARLGYKDVTIFEKEDFTGGLSTSEIPENRLKNEDVLFETRLMKDLGVKVVQKELGKDFTIEDLKKDHHEAIFYGIGKPEPKTVAEFGSLTTKNGFFTSKNFLPLVNRIVKKRPRQSCAFEKSGLPSLYGHVLILGAGDTAMDCASSAFRCGAKSVSVVLRRGFQNIRAVAEERDALIREKANFLTNFTLNKINCNKEDNISSVVLNRTSVEGGKVIVDKEQTLKVSCNFIISAFGSKLTDQTLIQSSAPVQFNNWGDVIVDELGQVEGTKDIWAGGDVIGHEATVEATNDGKVSAWHMHCYIQKIKNGTDLTQEEPALPPFCTQIDNIDLSVEMAGMKFENPFGFASAPPATSAAMMARGFDDGWAFAVTKTIVMDMDFITNISPRIVRGTTSGHNYGPHQSSYLNIEMVSEKSMEYWLESIRQLKKKYPTKIVIASIMAPYEKKTWITLAKYFEAAGSDALELNLSCPHGTGEKGMGLAVGQHPPTVKEITEWVKKSVKIPVFSKMTPNITDITQIAKGAMEGGADGVLCTNTVSALMGLKPNGVAWPNVNGKSTYGGMSGNAIRPMALKALSKCFKELPGLELMGSGGCESGETALQMIHCGAKVCQVSSAVHNQNFSIITDLMTGLRTLMWINANPKFKDWEGQSPPMAKKRREPGMGKKLSYVGDNLMKRRAAIIEDIQKSGPLVDELEDVDFDKKLDDTIIKVPSVNEICGAACKNIVKFFQMDPKVEHHVVTIIDEDLCVNCGRCYQTCADCGYQAIKFDEKTHLPVVDEDDCTGCGLCLSVCPIQNCITTVKRKTGYEACRGLPLGNYGKEKIVDDYKDVVSF